MYNVNSANGALTLQLLPDKCPFCHKSITPNTLYGYRNAFSGLYEILMACPDIVCNRSFLGYYRASGSFQEFTGQISQGNVTSRTFEDVIIETSVQFQIIYNEAFVAEQLNLLEICGVGYRKALEFLIKDYSVLNHPQKKEAIEKAMLGQVIDKYVNDNRVKSVAKRAVWLGNDETHYIKKWEGKDLADLKKLIDLTVHWIEMEALTASFEDDMPE